MNSRDDLRVSVVSPVYGCDECLRDLADGVRRALQDYDCSWELILVDDRGSDRAWKVISDLVEADPRIRGLRLSRNHGQHLAIWAGLEEVRGDFVVVLDCDLQDDPAIITQLLAKVLNTSADGVLVDRGEWSDTWFRRTSSKIFHGSMKTITGIDLKNAGNFGIYSRRLVGELLRFREQEVFLPYMVAILGFDLERISLGRSERTEGRSSYTMRSLLRLACGIVIRFSDRPLKVSAIAGLVVSSLSLGFSLLIVMGKLLGVFTVPGWTSVVLSIWFLAGVFLLVLGIHGYYLGRVFAEVSARPRIIVSNRIGSGLGEA